jgi:DNA-binding NarL/FixJ family response regulator
MLVQVSLRCLIVDDNPRFSDAARSLLEEDGISVVGVATSGNEAVRLASELAPDVALVDISLGDESGFEIARRLVDRLDAPAPTVILVSTHEEQEFSDRIAASPAAGFLAKTDLSASSIRRLVGT